MNKLACTRVALFVILIGCLTASQASADTGAEPAGRLIVRVTGLESDEGQLRFALFDSEEEFMKRPVRAELTDILEGNGTWTVEGLPYGTYAVLVHHDVDSSGVMERHWYGKPKEPAGASNDAPSKFGPPKFKDAKFQLDAPTLELSITVR